MSIAEISELQRKLDDALRRFGASMVGFCSVSDLETEVCKRLPFGIALAIDHERSAVDALPEDDRPFLKAGQTARNRMYRIYGIASQLLRSWGYSYAPIPDDTQAELLTDYSTEIPLKLLAVRAGLGWIGKSGLLVTSRYGPRIRLGGLLTDAPFEITGRQSTDNCKDCKACVEICPVGAISGVEWSPGIRRERMFDPARCNNWRRESLATLGRKHECALCMAVCPLGAAPGYVAASSSSEAGHGKAAYFGYRNGRGAVQALGDTARECELTPEELAFLEQDDDALSDDTYDQFVEDCCSGLSDDLLAEEQDLAVIPEPSAAAAAVGPVPSEEAVAAVETVAPEEAAATNGTTAPEPENGAAESASPAFPTGHETAESDVKAIEPDIDAESGAEAKPEPEAKKAEPSEAGSEKAISPVGAAITGEEAESGIPTAMPAPVVGEEDAVGLRHRTVEAQQERPRGIRQETEVGGEHGTVPLKPSPRRQNRNYGQRRSDGQDKQSSGGPENAAVKVRSQEADKDKPSDQSAPNQPATGSATAAKSRRRPSNTRRRPAAANKQAQESTEAKEPQIKPNPGVD